MGTQESSPTSDQPAENEPADSNDDTGDIVKPTPELGAEQSPADEPAVATATRYESTDLIEPETAESAEDIHAHFAHPHRQPPQRFLAGRGQVPPMQPLDPIQPYIAKRPRRRRSDWPVLVFALILAGAVMAACCIAGFALYSTYNAR